MGGISRQNKREGALAARLLPRHIGGGGGKSVSVTPAALSTSQAPQQVRECHHQQTHLCIPAASTKQLLVVVVHGGPGWRAAATRRESHQSVGSTSYLVVTHPGHVKVGDVTDAVSASGPSLGKGDRPHDNGGEQQAVAVFFLKSTSSEGKT